MDLERSPVDTDIPLALQGDADALERVLLAAQPLIFNLALRMLGRRADALDITQEVLLKIATHLSEYRRESRFSTWVYRIGVNALLDEKRAAASAASPSWPTTSKAASTGWRPAATRWTRSRRNTASKRWSWRWCARRAC